MTTTQYIFQPVSHSADFYVDTPSAFLGRISPNADGTWHHSHDTSANMPTREAAAADLHDWAQILGLVSK
jgi:hypothetical protein